MDPAMDPAVVLPTLVDLLGNATAYRIPLTTTFRSLDVRRGVLLQGPSGWGEFAPFDNYSVRADARWLQSAIEASHGQWPAPLRHRVEVNAIVPAVGAEDAQRLVRESGCSAAKVKVAGAGSTLADDLARVAAVREALGPSGGLRIDVNGSWSVSQAEQAIRQLAQCDLEYVEQPCASLSELTELRARVDVPIAVDESLRTSANPLKIAGLAEAADVIIVKSAPLGGVLAASRIASEYGLPVVVSSALETSIGLSAGLALAASLPELRYSCGLGTGRLLSADVVREPLIPVNGSLTLSRSVVDAEKLANVRADDELPQWSARIDAAYQLLHANYEQSGEGVRL